MDDGCVETTDILGQWGKKVPQKRIDCPNSLSLHLIKITCQMLGQHLQVVSSASMPLTYPHFYLHFFFFKYVQHLVIPTSFKSKVQAQEPPLFLKLCP